jgi:hypothetical protein
MVSSCALVGIERREVVEEDLALARAFGLLEVDRLDLEQREVALAVLGRADLPGDGVAGAQVEAADLRGRDVDVVGPGQIVVVGRAQEAEAVGQASLRKMDVWRGDESPRRGSPWWCK